MSNDRLSSQRAEQSESLCLVAIEKRSGLRAASIVGYRSPNYEVNNKQWHWQMLREHQFVYDSTLITREWSAPDSHQKQPAPFTWPHTRNFGTTYDCSQGCYTLTFPGLWTVPIHMYQDFGQSPRSRSSTSRCVRFSPFESCTAFLMTFDSYWINEPYTTWRFEGLK